MIDLCDLIRKNDVAGVRELISEPHQSGEQFRLLDEYPLAVAVGCGNLEIATALLEAGADPNFQDFDESILLICDDSRILETLLRHGANPLTEETKDGFASIHKAAQSGDLQLARLLVESIELDKRSQLLNRMDLLGYTPLMYAVQENKSAMAEYLIRAGSDVNAVSHARIGVPALHVAVNAKNLSLVELLLKAGADPSLSVGLNETPLALAATQFPEALNLLTLPRPSGGTMRGNSG